MRGTGTVWEGGKTERETERKRRFSFCLVQRTGQISNFSNSETGLLMLDTMIVLEMEGLR